MTLTDKNISIVHFMKRQKFQDPITETSISWINKIKEKDDVMINVNDVNATRPSLPSLDELPINSSTLDSGDNNGDGITTIELTTEQTYVPNDGVSTPDSINGVSTSDSSNILDSTSSLGSDIAGKPPSYGSYDTLDKLTNMSYDIIDQQPNMTYDIMDQQPNMTYDIMDKQPNMTYDIMDKQPNMTYDIMDKQPNMAYDSVDETSTSTGETIPIATTTTTTTTSSSGDIIEIPSTAGTRRKRRRRLRM